MLKSFSLVPSTPFLMRQFENLCGHSVARISSIQFLYIPNFCLNTLSFNSSSSRINSSRLGFSGNTSSNNINNSSSMSRSTSIWMQKFSLASLVQLPSKQALLVSNANTKLFLTYCSYTLMTISIKSVVIQFHLSPSEFLENFTFIPLGMVVIVVTVVALILQVIVFNSISTSSNSSINILPFGQ